MSEQFEIIDRYGARWRYDYAKGYRWSWGIKAETIDADDRDMVEVWKDVDDDSECVACFPYAALVGDVTPDTGLNFNLREMEPTWVREVGHRDDLIAKLRAALDRAVGLLPRDALIAAGYEQRQEWQALRTIEGGDRNG